MVPLKSERCDWLRRAETMEPKILGRQSACQNWIFQRPDATGVLGRYGTGIKPTFDRK